MSSREGFGVCDGTWPGGCLGVAGAGFQAAVQDADEAVAELAEGGVVAEPAGALLVVVAAGVRGWGAGGGGPGAGGGRRCGRARGRAACRSSGGLRVMWSARRGPGSAGRR